MEENSIFRQVANYKELHVYQKAEVLVLLTDVFCKRFLPLYGVRVPSMGCPDNALLVFRWHFRVVPMALYPP